MAPEIKKTPKTATTEKRILDLLAMNNHYLRENNAILSDISRTLKDMDDKLRKMTLSWTYR